MQNADRQLRMTAIEQAPEMQIDLALGLTFGWQLGQIVRIHWPQFWLLKEFE